MGQTSVPKKLTKKSPQRRHDKLMIFMFSALTVSMGAGASIYVFKWLPHSSSHRPAHDANKKKMTEEKANLERYRKGVVREALLKHNSKLQQCYEDFLRSDPQGITEGSLMVQWQVQPDGSISKTEVTKSEFSSQDFDACIIEGLKEAQFLPPPQQAPLVIVRKFNFSRKSPKEIVFE